MSDGYRGIITAEQAILQYLYFFAWYPYILFLDGLLYLLRGESWLLTPKGEFEGGSYQNSRRYGRYIVWPEAIEDHPLLAALDSQGLELLVQMAALEPQLRRGRGHSPAVALEGVGHQAALDVFHGLAERSAQPRPAAPREPYQPSSRHPE